MEALPTSRWRIWIDTGGTFTDGVAVAPDGAEHRVKILSTSALRGTLTGRRSPSTFSVAPGLPGAPNLIEGLSFRLLGREHGRRTVRRYDAAAGEIELDAELDSDPPEGGAFELASDEPPPILAARLLTGTPSSRRLPGALIRLATTLGTNTLLQRAGAPTALFITRGFGDLLAIGNQQRPDLFSLRVEKPAPLYEAVVEVPERLAADGNVLTPLDPEFLETEAQSLLERGIRVAAIALLHAYRHSAHEQLLKQRLLEWGFEHVSCSSELASRIKLLPRAQTAVVDAYLSPAVRTYLDRVQSSVEAGQLLAMTSAGGLLAPDGYRPKDSLLSGPAGGVVGAARAGRRSGFTRLIGFDMGGTSTDVARFDGDYEYVYEHQVGDAQLVAPALAIESVAAGGGSICWLDGERLRVGPRSAGARPGPACYDAGGPLTLTDVNLLVGRIDPERFEIPIRVEPARERLRQLQQALSRATGEQAETDAILEGLLSIADETMADAIRKISLRRGYDPAEYALLAFGGAGAQHACSVAARLGIGTIVVPPDAALLSAWGLGHAVVERFTELQVLEPLERVLRDVPAWLEELGRSAAEAVGRVGIPADQIVIRRRILHLRFVGQDATVEVEWDPDASVKEAFERRYAELFGHRPERRGVELESIRVVASSRPPNQPETQAGPPGREVTGAARRSAVFGGQWLQVPEFDRDELQPGDRFDGPAIVVEQRSVTVVDADWSCRVDSAGALILERRSDRSASAAVRRPEAIRLELFTQRFHTLVEEMGQRLEQTAVSTNVKERLDFSCALLDPGGELVVNAPHIPVHLGALGLCVRRLKETLPLEPGDVVATNHPSYGGSHLPDVTVVTPVFTEDRNRLLGYVASRAHHAEIGGSRPGSMPPEAACLADEGVVIAPTYLVRAAEPDWETIRGLLESPPYPSRNVEDNLADLRAAVAANHAGLRALRQLAGVHGADTLQHYMEQLKQMAEARIREALGAIADGTYSATEALDDGTPLAVRIELTGDRAHIDFSGSGARHPGNLNATPAIVQSAVIYVLRLLLRHPLPLNEGLLRAVTIELPPGLLNPDFPEDPRLAPAVVGGNVETSQRLVDTLLRALEVAACSQGTMNNLIFGNPGYGYYETLGGGCGAGPDFEGASAVHSHMTNTRITDPEILEHRYPVRVERFGISRGSGGGGRFRGGDGLIREIVFLEPASVSILSQHREVAPYGLHGGQPGLPGRQRVVRTNGEEQRLAAIDGCEVERGDRLIVETPGGGGCGAA